MLGNDELLLRMLAEGAEQERIDDYVAWMMQATAALGVKTVNPGGISAFKFNGARPRYRSGGTAARRDAAPHHPGAGARAARARRAASAAYALQQSRHTRQYRDDARHHRRRRRLPDPPDACAVPRLWQGRRPPFLVGRGAPRRGGQRQSQRHPRCRPDHVRPDRDRVGRHHGAVSQPRLRLARQVDRDGHRMRRRLRPGAVPLSRQEFRQRAAMGDRAGAVPADRGSVARLPDHRSSERRALHRLPAR